MEVRS